jgi:hypothetical protein
VEVSDGEVPETVQKLKNRKYPGEDGVTIEIHVLKHGGNMLVLEITKLIQEIFIPCKIPEDWKTSIAMPIFKTGDKFLPENYRGINLLCTLHKSYNQNYQTQIVSLCDEQQRFRRGRSFMDAFVTIRQISEKALEYK